MKKELKTLISEIEEYTKKELITLNILVNTQITEIEETAAAKEASLIKDETISLNFPFLWGLLVGLCLAVAFVAFGFYMFNWW